MAAILDVWIAKPGHPCYVDDHGWVRAVFDSEASSIIGQQRLRHLPAPHAHWAGTIRPAATS